MSKVLIVEDDEVIAQGMARHLTAAGFDPVCVNRGDLGLQRLRFEHPAVCILDLMLPGIDGWRFLETARAEGLVRVARTTVERWDEGVERMRPEHAVLYERSAP